MLISGNVAGHARVGPGEKVAGAVIFYLAIVAHGAAGEAAIVAYRSQHAKVQAAHPAGDVFQLGRRFGGHGASLRRWRGRPVRAPLGRPLSRALVSIDNGVGLNLLG